MMNNLVASILLNYNSEEDLFISVSQLLNQNDINQKIIIVDNSSKEETVKKIQNWQNEKFPDAVCGTYNNVISNIKNHTTNIYIVYNDINNGYSAGNNIGIRIADKLNADVVLIANPDMRFENLLYIKTLSDTLFSDEKAHIVASKIVGLDGKDQSPIKETTFWEEFTWPRFLLRRFVKISSYILPYKKDVISKVPKVMGCCLMLRMDFLRKINFLDENTFLYCEEPILSAQVKQYDGYILFNPNIEAIHAHKASEKGNSSKRMLLFIKSRRYYLYKYSGYSNLKLLLLEFSYMCMFLIYWLKSKVVR